MNANPRFYDNSKQIYKLLSGSPALGAAKDISSILPESKGWRDLGAWQSTGASELPSTSGGTTTQPTATPAPNPTPTPAPVSEPATALDPSPTTTVSQPTSSPSTVYLSSLKTVSERNGLGPFERNQSNGGSASNDGQTIRLNEKTYKYGLGVHANSRIGFAIPAECTEFVSDIGVDDEVGSKGTVVFRIELDGAEVFRSPVMTGNSATDSVKLNIKGKKVIEVIAAGSGDNTNSDSADWANAHFVCN